MRRVSCRIEGSPCAARPGLRQMKSSCVASLYSTSVFGRWSLVAGRWPLVAPRSVIPSEVEGPCVDLDQRPTTNDDRPTTDPTPDYPDAPPSPDTPPSATVSRHPQQSSPTGAARPCSQKKSSDNSSLRECSAAKDRPA